MKTMQKITLFVLACTFIVSCSIEKRHYMPGYHVEWKNKAKTTPAVEETFPAKTTPVAPVTELKEDKPAELTPVLNTRIEPVETIKTPFTTPANTGSQIKGDNIAIPTNNTTAFAQENSQEQEITTTLAAPVKNVQGPKEPMASTAVLVILCILFPLSILAVGIATDWGEPVIWNLLWCLTLIGGIIHGIIVVTRE